MKNRHRFIETMQPGLLSGRKEDGRRVRRYKGIKNLF